MPDVNGKLQFVDYKSQLIARGFDSFSDADLGTYINFGYRYIARSFPFSWEESQRDYSIDPGTYQIGISGSAPLTANSIETVVIKSANYNRKLEPEEERRFKRRWLYKDLTQASAQGPTDLYYVWHNAIWLLPPPQVTTVYTVYFYQYLLDMVQSTDTPVMAQIYDELILDAALVRCHRRAHELQLAADAQARVDAAINDLLAADVWTMEELQERTLPDDQWW
jgi:hypothetical protein